MQDALKKQQLEKIEENPQLLKLRVDILSLFPNYFTSPLNQSMLKRARDKGIIEVNAVDIRDFAEGKHKQVDDRPYGGGPGMVLMPQPVTRAIRSVKGPRSHTIYLSPQGKILDAQKCRQLADFEHLILVAGHYEGIDERVIESEIDEEISIGDYVLTSGCLPALVLLDAVVRFVSGVIGDSEAAQQDSFECGIFDHPHYTRPEEFEGKAVPEVLKSGDHKKIEQWRKCQAELKTKKVRPDLYKSYKEKVADRTYAERD
ncbi:MAG: hypothetical protein Tsb0021_00480 [Chlamydiales bacterium]